MFRPLDTTPRAGRTIQGALKNFPESYSGIQRVWAMAIQFCGAIVSALVHTQEEQWLARALHVCVTGDFLWTCLSALAECHSFYSVLTSTSFLNLEKILQGCCKSYKMFTKVMLWRKLLFTSGLISCNGHLQRHRMTISRKWRNSWKMVGKWL